MDEYIKREDIKREMFVSKEYRESEYGQGWNNGLKALYLFAPIADVRENVRGEWQYTMLDFAGEKIKSLPYCSVCKEKQQFVTNFCPDCGADMRGEKDG